MAIPSWSHKKPVEKHIQLKNGHKNWIDIFLKKTYKLPIGTHKKRCSISFTVRKTQIKYTNMRYYLTAVWMATVKTKKSKK